MCWHVQACVRAGPPSCCLRAALACTKQLPLVAAGPAPATAPHRASLMASSAFSASSASTRRSACSRRAATPPRAPLSACTSARLAASSVRASCAASLREWWRWCAARAWAAAWLQADRAAWRQWRLHAACRHWAPVPAPSAWLLQHVAPAHCAHMRMRMRRCAAAVGCVRPARRALADLELVGLLMLLGLPILGQHALEGVVVHLWRVGAVRFDAVGWWESVHMRRARHPPCAAAA